MVFLKKIHWNFKLLAVLIIVAAIPATIIVMNVLNIIRDELKSNINNQLLFSSNEVAKQIDEHYDKTFEVLDLVKQNLLNENLGGNERINLILSIIKSVDNIVGITIAFEEESGVLNRVVSAFKDTITVDKQNIAISNSLLNPETYYEIETDNIFISNFEYLSKLKLWEQIVKIRLPLPGKNNLFLYAHINSNNLHNYIASHPLKKGGTIFIIDNEGNNLFDEGNDLSDYGFLSGEGKKLLSTSQRFSIVNKYTSPKHESVVACFALPELVPWVIITGIKETFAYSVVSDIVDTFLGWLGISLFTTALISFVFSRGLSKPIREMSSAALEIARGNFDTKISYPANDSIGLLGKSLEKMSNDLDANFKEINNQRKMLEDYSKNLEKKVEERTIELVKANEEISKSYKQVLELNNEKNEFLGIAAHDLKNPLTVIKGYTDILIADKELPGEIRQGFLDEIMGASNRMFDIVTNLLDVNAIEQGKIKIKKEFIPVSTIIEEIFNQNSENAAKKEIRIHKETVDDSILVYVDRNLTLQIVDNLISNAIKFTSIGKNIYINCKINNDEKFVSIAIRDEGPGFSEEDKKKVFGKFARLSAKPTAGENSTGLGLSIVKKLVELQKAYILLESEQGEGATFILKLPMEIKE